MGAHRTTRPPPRALSLLSPSTLAHTSIRGRLLRGGTMSKRRSASLMSPSSASLASSPPPTDVTPLHSTQVISAVLVPPSWSASRRAHSRQREWEQSRRTGSVNQSRQMGHLRVSSISSSVGGLARPPSAAAAAAAPFPAPAAAAPAAAAAGAAAAGAAGEGEGLLWMGVGCCGDAGVLAAGAGVAASAVVVGTAGVALALVGGSIIISSRPNNGRRPAPRQRWQQRQPALSKVHERSCRLAGGAADAVCVGVD